MTPEEMVSRVLYRDALMLVIDKPPGLAVHAGPPSARNRRESIEDHFDALRFGLPRPPALAHRLDRDTSGCLILGRHRKALAHLGKLFRNGEVDKTYWAVVEGSPEADEGVIDFPLGRLDDTRGWWMKHDPAGQPAVTKWRVMGMTHNSPPPCGEGSGVGVVGPTRIADALPDRTTPLPTLPRQKGVHARLRQAMGGGKLTWLELEPVTGRTHQLRVHCAEMGWPIIGDPIYGTAPRFGGPILHLHARGIVVPLYKNREPTRVVAPVPAHMREALTACGWKEEAVLPRVVAEVAET
jgi:tRNA pseudouridine32 synthase / 23S rRNA pseudouridine746 synthase